jgi:hypothetical protein
MRALLVGAVLCVSASAMAASSPPLSEAWNIAPSGTAASSGELLFRVTPSDGEDPVEVTVFVLSGTNETGVASNIRRALSSRLKPDRFNIEAGQGVNVLVTPAGGKGDFALELVDSDVENVRVLVQSAAPIAPPTVPRQEAPANTPSPATPPAHGDVTPPPAEAAPPPQPEFPPAQPPASTSQPDTPPPANTPMPTEPGPTPASPPDAGEAGAPASAPPPGSTPTSTSPRGALHESSHSI